MRKRKERRKCEERAISFARNVWKCFSQTLRDFARSHSIQNRIRSIQNENRISSVSVICIARIYRNDQDRFAYAIINESLSLTILILWRAISARLIFHATTRHVGDRIILSREYAFSTGGMQRWSISCVNFANSNTRRGEKAVREGKAGER